MKNRTYIKVHKEKRKEYAQLLKKISFTFLSPKTKKKEKKIRIADELTIGKENKARKKDNS